LEELEIESVYFKEIYILPPQLKKLICGNTFDGKIMSYPDSLIEIKFGNNYNNDINNIPDSVIILILGKKFTQTITKLPKSLKYITMNNRKENIENVKNINSDIKISFNHWSC
jgi:hypothetical protein